MKHFAAHDQMDARRVRLLEELAYQHGLYFDSYLVTEPNREYLWSSNDRAVVGFARVGRYLHVVGGVLAHESDKPRMLSELVAFARLNRLTISFFHIEDREIPQFRSMSFQVTKFGVESRVRLAGHTWKGKQYEWVRRQSNYVARHSVVFEEWRRDDANPQDWSARFAELREVSGSCISGRTLKVEIPFFEGQLLEKHLCRRRVFVARVDGGRVEGFVICNPIDGGRAWAIEMYRHRLDSVRGTIAYLMYQTIEHLKAEGCDEVSICPIPTIDCESKLPGDSFVVRSALNLWRRFEYALFDMNGIYHFKSRFRPEYRDMFVCAYPKSNLGATLAYVRLLGIMRFKLADLLKKLFQWSPQRRTLARPYPVPQTATVAIANATNDEQQSRAA